MSADSLHTVRARRGALTALAWSTDGRLLFVADMQRTLAVPVSPGHWFPEFPPDGTAGIDEWMNLKGARWISSPSVAAPDASTYVFVKREDSRNLFRIPIK